MSDAATGERDEDDDTRRTANDLRAWDDSERLTVRIPKPDLEALVDDPQSTSVAIREAMAEYCDTFAWLVIYPNEDGVDADHGSDLRSRDCEIKRTTFRCPTGLVDDLDTLCEYGLAANRSRAIRDAIRFANAHAGDDESDPDADEGTGVDRGDGIVLDGYGVAENDGTAAALRELHRQYESLEQAVEDAIYELRAHTRPGQTVRKIASNLEAELEGEAPPAPDDGGDSGGDGR